MTVVSVFEAFTVIRVVYYIIKKFPITEVSPKFKAFTGICYVLLGVNVD